MNSQNENPINDFVDVEAPIVEVATVETEETNTPNTFNRVITQARDLLPKCLAVMIIGSIFAGGILFAFYMSSRTSGGVFLVHHSK